MNSGEGIMGQRKRVGAERTRNERRKDKASRVYGGSFHSSILLPPTFFRLKNEAGNGRGKE